MSSALHVTTREHVDQLLRRLRTSKGSGMIVIGQSQFTAAQPYPMNLAVRIHDTCLRHSGIFAETSRRSTCQSILGVEDNIATSMCAAASTQRQRRNIRQCLQQRVSPAAAQTRYAHGWQRGSGR
eukprot:6806921-Pyramimonas_sp.AAC.1